MSTFILLAIAVGFALTIQGLVNTALQVRMGLFVTIFINCVLSFVGAAILLVGAKFLSSAKTSLSVQGIPWVWLTGGLMGVFIVGTVAYVYPRLGATWSVTLIILGQFAMALVADHYGWLGIERTPVTFSRLLGLALVLAGCVLVRR